jgi:3-hydroxyacyl-[acyl-carrier-protein] dehydratase
MLVSEDNILQLIPQRYPMVMIHSLLYCDDKQVVSRFEIREDNIFLDDKGMTASGLMENMAQTAASRTGWLMKNHPEGENKKVPVGVIGSIKNFKLHFQPEVGSVIETTVTVEHEVLQASVVKGRVECAGNLVAESEMQIFLTENQ